MPLPQFIPFTTPLMKILCRELQERAAHYQVVDCLSDENTRFFLILASSRKREALFFSFKPPFIRFHLATFPKKISQSPHPLLFYLKEGRLNDASILQEDRILQLTFSTPKGERKLIGEFFSKHPNYYVIDSDRKILAAMHPSPHTHYELPPHHSFISPPPLLRSHEEVEKAYAEFEERWEFVKEKNKLAALISKQIKNGEKKEKQLQEKLKTCMEWPTINHEADLIKYYYHSIKKGMTSLNVHDWITDNLYQLILNPALSPQEMMTTLYKLAKKLQRGERPLCEHLTVTKNQLIDLKGLQEKVNIAQTIQELSLVRAQFPGQSKKQSFKAQSGSPPLVYKEYASIEGTKIWVGKNGKANDRLTFQLANGRDWWVHVRGSPGSHVIIRMNKDQEADPEALQDAFQLALYYSKARKQGEGEICFTQKKYVSRLGQKREGLVQISKHQTAWVRLDEVRLQRLKTCSISSIG